MTRHPNILSILVLKSLDVGRLFTGNMTLVFVLEREVKFHMHFTQSTLLLATKPN